MNRFYIDDTGTPSFSSKSKYDPGDWNTWVAYFVPDFQREKLNHMISELFEAYREEYTIKEFHFKDIYSGKGTYRKMKIEDRLVLFQKFADIYSYFKFPILVQSLTSDDIIRNEMIHLKQLKIDGFNFSYNEDLALWFLLDKIEKHVWENTLGNVEIFVDSGRQKPNTTQKVELLNKVTLNSIISYISSESDFCMQMADFLAYSINKQRWIFMNNKKTDLDLSFTKILMSADLNTINLKKRQINFNEFTATDYDNQLRDTYNLNGNLSDDDVDKIKSSASSE